MQCETYVHSFVYMQRLFQVAAGDQQDADMLLLLCAYWCSDEYKVKHKRGQTCCSSNEDISQNRGGSRPFTETQVLVCKCIFFIL
jgi:hypothetical protein